ncbi:Alpha-1,2 mannosyltransferase KTR1, partial [Neolecta irregularis DAH-3]
MVDPLEGELAMSPLDGILHLDIWSEVEIASRSRRVLQFSAVEYSEKEVEAEYTRTSFMYLKINVVVGEYFTFRDSFSFMPSYRDYSDNPFEKYRYAKRPQSRRKLFQVVFGLIFGALCLFFWFSPLKRPATFVIKNVVPTVKPQFGKPLGKTVGRENATNRELDDALSSIRQIEDRFNHKFHYPWVFLNDEPFTKDFIKYTSGMANGNVEYGLIPREHWSVPDHIDMDRVQKAMKQMHDDNVIYGDSLSYRHMCRYNSGFFWRHELTLKYDWYWRVEPGIKFTCTIDYDVFEFMRTNNKTYSFTLSLPEYQATI